MAEYVSDQVTNKKYFPGASPHSAREVHCVFGTVAIADTLAISELIKLVVLPPNCVPVDCVLISTDLDSAGPTLVIDVGILNAAGDDLVPTSDLITASTVGGAGGVERMNSPECAFAAATWLAEATCPAKGVEKTVIGKVTTAATTPAAGTMYFMLFYRAAELGV